MSLRGTLCARGLVVYAVVLAAAALAVALAGSAHAAYYKMVLCGANNGSNSFATATNTTSPQNPGGIFSIENYCGPAPYPAGNSAFLRISENQPNGSAGNTAYGQVSWTAPSYVQIAAAGGYTRYQGSFNDGWRGRFWLQGYDGSTNNILVQGAGVANGSCGGVCWGLTPNFGSHLWPFGGYGSYGRFVFELTCMRPAGCDRSGWNVVEANSFQLMLNDSAPPASHYTEPRPFQDGQWVRGNQTVSWMSADEGSGIRFERLRVDGGEHAVVDRRGTCNIDWNPATGEFARDFVPCIRSGWYHSAANVNTASLADGTHTLSVCIQDYGQSQSGGETCNSRTVRTDNRAPAAPGGLSVVTPNAARYVDTVGAHWALPADPGSPIVKAHYTILDASGKAVVAQKTLSATNPTELGKVQAPQAPGDYRLRVWLEDQVGWQGAASTVPLPRDTVPPAAPQGVTVAAPSSPRASEGFDVRWTNIVDAGAPITGVRYQVLNAAGEVVVPTQAIDAANVEAIPNLQAPGETGAYDLRLWLIDGEGNVGAPASVPLAYGCVRSPSAAGQQLSAGFGGAPETLVQQDEGSTLSGVLRGAEGPVGGAPICVFSRVITEHSRQFVGLAMTTPDGSYRFAVAPGPSRVLTVVHRPDTREISAQAVARTQVRPTLKSPSGVVRNKSFAYFEGEIPGPNNNQVVIVMQVRSGKGWLAFRRYRTREGRYSLRYHFRRTSRPTTYQMRAQVRQTAGYPYEQGNSPILRLRVVPGRACPKGKRAVKRKGKARCPARSPGRKGKRGGGAG